MKGANYAKYVTKHSAILFYMPATACTSNVTMYVAHQITLFKQSCTESIVIHYRLPIAITDFYYKITLETWNQPLICNN